MKKILKTKLEKKAVKEAETQLETKKVGTPEHAEAAAKLEAARKADGQTLKERRGNIRIRCSRISASPVLRDLENL